MLPLLACPHCACPRCDRLDAGVVGCRNGHRFDIARQGYLSLLGKASRTDTGDSADMVAARVDFLGAGHYRPVAEAVADRGDRPGRCWRSVPAPAITWRPCSTGSGRRPARPVGVALDASRYAARRAAAAHPRIGSVVADAWSRLPVRRRGVGTVLSVFAPRDPAEIARVLAPDGRLVVVTPEPDHLAEIRGPLGFSPSTRESRNGWSEALPTGCTPPTGSRVVGSCG